MSYTGGNSARVGDPCPIHGCGKPLRKPKHSMATSQASLVCPQGHYVVDLNAPKAKASGDAAG